jgi:ADP-ribose pyrophosphatase
VTTRPIERESLLEGRIFTVERCTWTTGDGTPVVREVVRHPGAVTIVPVLEDGRLVFVKNWRIAVAIRPIGRYYTSPGFADELMHAFEATGLVAGEARPEPGEEVEARAFTLDEIRHMTESGELIDGKTLAALHLWHSCRETS